MTYDVDRNKYERKDKIIYKTIKKQIYISEKNKIKKKLF